MLSGICEPIKMGKSYAKCTFPCCEFLAPALFHIHRETQFRHFQSSGFIDAKIQRKPLALVEAKRDDEEPQILEIY